jgi:hypothetical protein
VERDTSKGAGPTSVTGPDEPTLSGPHRVRRETRAFHMVDGSSAYGRAWTEEELEQLRQFAQHQLSAREIAQRTGRTPQAIKGKARGLGLALR